MDKRRARKTEGPVVDPSRHPSRSRSETEAVRRHLQSVPDQPIAGDPIVIEKPRNRVSDIVGLSTIKAALADITDANRERKHNEGSWLGGMLFYGPPSCGKHFSARTVAGELGAELWNVNMSAAAPVTETLDRLREAVTTGPRKVIFLEHLDAVIGHVDQHAGALLSSLVPILDGARLQNGSIILGSATFPWQVSPLVVRPGRLGHVLLVLPPDKPARREFLLGRLGEVTQTVEHEIDWLTLHTDGYSFGDLDELLEIAKGIVASSNEMAPREISHAALRTARQTSAPTSADWLTHAGHHAIMNSGGGMYDDLLAYFHQREKT